MRQKNTPFLDTGFQSGRAVTWELLNFVLLGVYCGVRVRLCPRAVKPAVKTLFASWALFVLEACLDSHPLR